MGKFSKEKIEIHLQNLEENIQVLKALQKEPFSNFQNKEKCYAVFHAFLLAIENIMDIGGHILVSCFKKSFTEYREIIPGLEEYKVIPKKFAKKCEGMAEFRNKLVHNYIKVNSEKVYQYLREDTPLFEKFAEYILKFAEKMKK